MNKRDYDDPQYKKWRFLVYKRDRFTCQWCGRTGKGAKINAHHIRQWAKYPTLRFDVKNGICLCSRCHKKTFGKEEQLAEFFHNKINKSRIHEINKMILDEQRIQSNN